MKQYKLAITILACTSLLSSNSFAKTIMKDETAPTVAAPYNWTGIYAGINAGIVNHTMSITDTQGTSFLSTIDEETNPRPSGGLQFGYRYQLDPTKTSGVFGAEFSLNFSNANFEKNYGSPYATYNLDSQNTLHDVCLLELMSGIAADKTLLFLSAGFSWVSIDGNTTSLNGAPFYNSFSTSKNVFGTAFGAGIEYAINQRFSARIKVDVITPDSYSTDDDTGNSFQISNSIVQSTVGLNFKLT